jgi:hypothetical protein
VQNEAGGILARLGISPGGRTLDPRRRDRNFAWTSAELNRRVNQRVGGNTGDRQNFTLDQINAGHDALPELVRQFEEQLRDAAA